MSPINPNFKIIGIFLLAALIVIGGAMIYYAGPSAPNSTSQNQPSSPEPAATPPAVPPADGGTTGSQGGKVLDLHNQGLTRLPTDIFNRPDVTTLNVSGNKLTGALPAEIRQLTNLVTLDASNNQLTGIPAEIGQLSKLETVNFADNGITGLPLEIGNLKKLKTINLSGNDYSTYDMSIIKQALPNLQVIGEK